jgi:peptide deformylase
MLPIVQAPHPALSKPARRIGKVDKTILDLIKEMTFTLENTRDPEGVGLAAPQVAQSLQLFIIKESPKSPLLVFINPEIKSLSKEQHEEKDETKGKRKKDSGVKLEGCLSLKDIWGIVHRAETVTLSYMDETGTQQEKTFNGFLATIIQHECDHLQGTLFPKRVLEQNGKMYKSIDEDGETVFEEISI